MTNHDALKHLHAVCRELKQFAFSRYEWSLFHEYYLAFHQAMNLVAAIKDEEKDALLD